MVALQCRCSRRGWRGRRLYLRQILFFPRDARCSATSRAFVLIHNTASTAMPSPAEIIHPATSETDRPAAAPSTATNHRPVTLCVVGLGYVGLPLSLQF